MLDKIMKWLLFAILSPFYISTKWWETFKGDAQKLE